MKERATMNKPSLKTLETAFPTKGAILRKLLTSEKAVREHPAAIARNAECYHAPTLADLRMHALNTETECFGVEYVQGNGTRRSPSFEYLNAGDTYATTIVRFSNGRYRVTTWGDIVERGNYA
jgi:hypothetical protein